MSLSIIIVNYKSEKFIYNCIKSALEYSPMPEAEWLVVDNSENRNEANSIINDFPFVKYIRLKQNEGYGRANNEGAKFAKGETLLFLNPDCLFFDESFSICYNRFRESSHIACGVSLVYEDGSFQNSGHRFFPLGLNHLLSIPYYGSFLKWIAKIFNSQRPSYLHPSNEQFVDWISGAFLMVKRDAFELAGGFDPDFFLYSEEIELCYRLKKLGTAVIYGDLKIIHLEGKSINSATNSSDQSYLNLYEIKGRQLILSNLLRIRKQYGISGLLFHFLNYWISLPIYMISFFIISILKLNFNASNFRRMTGYIANIIAVSGFLPRLIGNKPFLYKVL